LPRLTAARYAGAKYDDPDPCPADHQLMIALDDEFMALMGVAANVSAP
jgi:hypothetical protein